MPAASEPPLVALPHTFRPFGVRLAIVVMGVLLAALLLVMWFHFPQHTRDAFTTFQRITIVAIGLGVVACGYALARCRVEAREDGLTVVNGYRSRRLEWSQVLAISLRTGSPWATLDLSDGTAIAAWGSQGSDGDYALRQARLLRAVVRSKSHTDRND
jgi:hypothetical protein